MYETSVHSYTRQQRGQALQDLKQAGIGFSKTKWFRNDEKIVALQSCTLSSVWESWSEEGMQALEWPGRLSEFGKK